MGYCAGHGLGPNHPLGDARHEPKKPASISYKSSSEEVTTFSHPSQAEARPSVLPPSPANAQGHLSRYNES